MKQTERFNSIKMEYETDGMHKRKLMVACVRVYYDKSLCESQN